MRIGEQIYRTFFFFFETTSKEIVERLKCRFKDDTKVVVNETG